VNDSIYTQENNYIKTGPGKATGRSFKQKSSIIHIRITRCV